MNCDDEQQQTCQTYCDHGNNELGVQHGKGERKDGRDDCSDFSENREGIITGR